MQKTLIGVVIGVAVVIGGYFLLKPKTTDSPANTTNDSVKVASTGNNETISELMKKGGAYKCTWSQEGYAGSSSQGTAYISGGMLKVEQNVKTVSTNMDNSFLSREGYVYNWSSVNPNLGSKVKIQENIGNLKPGVPSSSLGMYLAIYDQSSQIPGYDCKSWSVDASVFTPPANIKFVGN